MCTLIPVEKRIVIVAELIAEVSAYQYHQSRVFF